MVKPQQPELGRSRKGSTDKEGTEIRADSVLPEAEDGNAPVPEANQAGHHPEHEEDKPEVPPHER